MLQADGNVRWENIPDRMFTPEGMNITLEDGHFDVERARLLNKNLVTVGGGDVGSRKSKGKMAGLDCLQSTAKIEPADTIYVMTYRLPLITTRNPETVHFPISVAVENLSLHILNALTRNCAFRLTSWSRGDLSSSGFRLCRTKKHEAWMPPGHTRTGWADPHPA